MVFCLSRDEYIRSNSHYELHKPILDLNNNVLPDHVSAPPSGVQPFLGFASYFAPVCYIYKHKGSLYSVCRLIWCELWCKLNVLTSDPETLLSVCKTFEMLLLQIDPNLFLHLVGVGCQPLKVHHFYCTAYIHHVSNTSMYYLNVYNSFA